MISDSKWSTPDASGLSPRVGAGEKHFNERLLDGRAYQKYSAVNSYRAVLLDIDDTLYDYQAAHYHAIRCVFQNIALNVCDEVPLDAFICHYRRKRTEVTKMHNGTGATRSRFLAFLMCFEEMGLRMPYDLALNAEDLYWDTILLNMQPNYALIKALRDYFNVGGRICAVTDMQARYQVQKLRRLSLVTIIEHLVTSEEVGVEKPDARMFELALHRLKLNAEDVVMLGDSKNKDVMGAHAIGINAIHVDDFVK